MRLRARGCGIIYVSHRLDEVLDDRRHASAFCATAKPARPSRQRTVTKTKLVELMTGRDVQGGRKRRGRIGRGSGRALCSQSRRQGRIGSVLRSAEGRNPRSRRSRRCWRGAGHDAALIGRGRGRGVSGRRARLATRSLGRLGERDRACAARTPRRGAVSRRRHRRQHLASASSPLQSPRPVS